MKIDLKQPKYITPLLLLPFLCLFFYVYKSMFNTPGVETKLEKGMQGRVGNVSPEVSKRALDTKLDAYRDAYKEAEGNSVVSAIGEERSTDSLSTRAYRNAFQPAPQNYPAFTNNDAYVSPNSFATRNSAGISAQDKALAAALASLSNGQTVNLPAKPREEAPAEKDPMTLFKAQMAYIDSVGKANDPEVQEEQKRQVMQAKAETVRAGQLKIMVSKVNAPNSLFNSILPAKKGERISAIVDETVTGYAGSRIRIRLLEDIAAGDNTIRKGTYLYAQVNGFSGQRVTLSIESIISGEKIIPVKLDIYDTDGQLGLYVPESAFRDFTKELGGNSMQGVNLQSGSAGSQLLMSSLDKVFQSTSSAIAGAIRKNKAKIKYNSIVYLIDTEALRNEQKNY